MSAIMGIFDLSGASPCGPIWEHVQASGTSRGEAAEWHGAHGVVVSHPLSMREALGSIPSVSTLAPACFFTPMPGVFPSIPGGFWRCLKVF